MTLNLTVATRRCIYQSADYRLVDTNTGKAIDFETQKIVLVNRSTWSATVCFAGVGRTHKLDVSEWLADRMASIQFHDPFQRLIDELLKARDNWLYSVPSPHNRHSFSVGAFVGTKPVFALISNFEEPSGLVAATASKNLSVYVLRPSKPRTFVSGQKQAVNRVERKLLASIAAQDPAPQRMYSALADINRRAAVRNTFVSPACFTTHFRLTGDGGGCPHEMGDRPFLPKFATAPDLQEALTRLLDEQFGPGKARLVQMVTGRMDPSDAYYETQLREKPKDASTHSNYGAYLDKKGDLKGAEREYRKALELDSNHVNAQGNLANLLRKNGDRDQAAHLYRKALEYDPVNENVTWNYAGFLLAELDNRQGACDVLDCGIKSHPDSGRLLLLRAEQSLLNGTAFEALEGFRRAREKGADQIRVEAGYACALQISGAPIDECIGAYWVAIALNPMNGALRLNLAQLMFIKGFDTEANSQLHEAMKLKLVSRRIHT